MGRLVENDLYILSMHTVLEGGEILNYKKVNKGDRIYILDLLEYDKIFENTKAQIKKDFPRLSFCFLGGLYLSLCSLH